ncbi:MAG: SRPBCC family protein [Phycisphaeraceae bacterium]|nr:SRPBCC family protein [Phycisphaeraceae bacterium]
MASRLEPFSGEEDLPHSPDRIFALLTDPSAFAKIIPGVVSSERVDEKTLKAVVRPGFSFLKTNLTITLVVAERTPPGDALLRVDTKGIGLTMQVESRIHVEPAPNGSGSRVRWQAEVVKMSGLVTAVGSTLIRASANKVIRDGWDGVRAHLAAAP